MSNPLFKPRQQAQAPALQLALRPREAAAALGVCERTLWLWTREGGIPHLKKGKTVLYPVAGLQKWLDEQAQAQQPTEGGQHETH
jgi:excisionase family DNA binding protein